MELILLTVTVAALGVVVFLSDRMSSMSASSLAQVKNGLTLFAFIAVERVVLSSGVVESVSGAVMVSLGALEVALTLLGLGLVFQGMSEWRKSKASTNSEHALQRETPTILPATSAEFSRQTNWREMMGNLEAPLLAEKFLESLEVVTLEERLAPSKMALFIRNKKSQNGRQWRPLQSAGLSFAEVNKWLRIVESPGLESSPSDLTIVKMESQFASGAIEGALALTNIKDVPSENDLSTQSKPGLGLSELHQSLSDFLFILRNKKLESRLMASENRNRIALKTAKLLEADRMGSTGQQTSSLELAEGVFDVFARVCEMSPVFDSLLVELVDSVSGSVITLRRSWVDDSSQRRINSGGESRRRMGFYPLSQRIPLGDGLASGESRRWSNFPRFDTRPGWSRLAEENLGEALVGTLGEEKGMRILIVAGIGAGRSCGAIQASSFDYALKVVKPLMTGRLGQGKAPVSVSTSDASGSRFTIRSISDRTASDSGANARLTKTRTIWESGPAIGEAL